MGLIDAVEGRVALLGELGEVGLNLQFPNEFELYVIALELVDKDFKTDRYFIFPINPSSISETTSEITNTKKTAGGITILTNPHFIPSDISLSGNFGGKKFKFLMGETYQELIQSFKDNGPNLQSKLLYTAQDIFNNKIKTGYGCTKVLQDIFNRYRIPDDKGPRKLIFYNLALGTSYFVTPVSTTYSQSQESNMIWNYQLNLKTVAVVDSLVTRDGEKLKSNSQLAVDSYIQKSVDSTLTSINNIRL